MSHRFRSDTPLRRSEPPRTSAGSSVLNQTSPPPRKVEGSQGRSARCDLPQYIKVPVPKTKSMLLPKPLRVETSVAMALAAALARTVALF